MLTPYSLTQRLQPDQLAIVSDSSRGIEYTPETARAFRSLTARGGGFVLGIKGIKHTIYNNGRDFFFSHNGITAICNQMELTDDRTLRVKGVSVVNGCQSLNTILSCSEKVRATRQRLRDVPLL